ncbi:MAG: NUDIX domain-containing protein [Eubacteriales bacterium]|nr:NUDIX domain-containing protein [Eubacteriales bacterium]
MGIRNAAKAILLHEGKILLNQCRNCMGDLCYGLPNGAIYYVLPGGGQHQYETLEEAVERECLEESGYTVSAERLAAVCEEIFLNERLRAQYEAYSHTVYFIFLCRLTGAPQQPPTQKDRDMLQSQWIDVAAVKDLPLYPRVLRTQLDKILQASNTLFLDSQRIP